MTEKSMIERFTLPPKSDQVGRMQWSRLSSAVAGALVAASMALMSLLEHTFPWWLAPVVLGLTVLSDRSMARVIQRLEHPDEVRPPNRVWSVMSLLLTLPIPGAIAYALTHRLWIAIAVTVLGVVYLGSLYAYARHRKKTAD